jgi:NhaP-type Na+/H+ or K+/H+ antiporter
MEMALVVIFVGLLILLAHLFAVLFERTRIPDVLILVFVGLLIGPVMGLVSPEAFGKAGDVFTVIALVIILFESGLGLSFSTLREAMLPAIWLTLINFAGAVLVVTTLSILMFNLSILEGLIIGSILGSTAPTVVIPLVNKLPLKQNSRTTLILESTFGEALCIVVTLGLLQAAKYSEVKPTLILGAINASFLLAAVIGGLAALFWSSLLHRVRQLENSTFTTTAFVFIIYGISELLGYSGAISAFAFGIVLGNVQSLRLPVFKKLTFLQPVSLNEIEKVFFAEAVFLLRTFFFVYIGLSVYFTDSYFILAGLGLTLAVFLIRIPAVKLAMNTKVARFDASIAAVMVPKGLAAAVLASLLLHTAMAKGGIMQEVAYSVIVLSIVVTTVLTFLIERTQLGELYASIFSRYTDEINTENKSE